MAIQVVQKRPDADPLEKLVNAVNVVKTVYGINVQSKELELAKQKAESDSLLAKQNATRQSTVDEKTGLEIEKLKRENAAADDDNNPNSPVIKTIRETLKKQGINLPEGVTPRQAKTMFDAFLKPKDPNAPNLKAPTEGQSTAALYAKRMGQAEDILSGLAAQGETGTSLSDAAGRKAPEAFKGDVTRQREQAERNFINAALRRESGAAISPSEFESAEKQYFPRYGDSEAVLANKAENRRLAIAGISAAAGDKALSNVDSQFSKTTPQKQAAPKGKVKVSNGKETLLIDVSDLSSAQADGYKRVN